MGPKKTSEYFYKQQLSTSEYFDKDISFPVVLLLCPTQSASIDRGIGGELSCLCHSSSASVQYSARSIEYYSPKVPDNVSIVQPAVFIPIPLTILSTIQQLFPTKNSFILHNSQANKTPKKQEYSKYHFRKNDEISGFLKEEFKLIQ